jgi:hypothetical protein
MRAIGVILQTKIFVNLQERLLVRDCPGEIAPAWIVAEQARGSDLEPAIGETGW